ncbi:hypothetical protein DJ532_02370 [Sulfolobus sp. A20-N-F8]|uniref:hypothetical protein n=1 Tax=Sulfolobaceae TaxID=118883 RepID=UPI00117F6099|nr:MULTISPECIES: hypothetical protein [unclassified Sulfolobus]TRM78077.1 hypothetical protein DJ532_02370 [Sulfolobus sp. A20-N-F8]
MDIKRLLICDQIGMNNSGQYYIEVDRLRILFEAKVNIGIIVEIILNSINYKLTCKIVFDPRYEKVIETSCIGFKEDKVKYIIQNCFKEKGILYTGKTSR